MRDHALNQSVVVRLWERTTPRDEVVYLTDETHVDFVHDVFLAFRPLALSGRVRPKYPAISKNVKEMLAAGDYIYLEPALFTERFQGKRWKDVTVADGGFMLNCCPWATREEWLAFLPYMIEFVLRADHAIDSVGSFLYFLNPANEDRTPYPPHVKEAMPPPTYDDLPNGVAVTVLEFLDRLQAKYEEEFGDPESDGDTLLMYLREAREQWASKYAA